MDSPKNGVHSDQRVRGERIGSEPEFQNPGVGLLAFYLGGAVGAELDEEWEGVVVRWDPPGEHSVVVEVEGSGEVGGAGVGADDGVAEEGIGGVEVVEEGDGALGGA